AGLHEAYASSIPIVVVSSQIPSAGLGGRRKGMLHELDDQQASARNVTKHQALVYKASSIPFVLEDAWRIALTPPHGPTWVEIPQDVLLEQTVVPAPSDINTSILPLRPHDESIAQAARLVAAAHRPVIVAGGGVRRSGTTARAALRELAEVLDAPVVCTP